MGMSAVHAHVDQPKYQRADIVPTMFPGAHGVRVDFELAPSPPSAAGADSFAVGGWIATELTEFPTNFVPVTAVMRVLRDQSSHWPATTALVPSTWATDALAQPYLWPGALGLCTTAALNRNRIQLPSFDPSTALIQSLNTIAASAAPFLKEVPATRNIVYIGAELRIRRLAQVQAAFGFTIQELAGILNRSRTQIYKWLDAVEPVELHSESRRRLEQISRLAERWIAQSAVPLSAVSREFLPGGATIVELLSEASIDEGAIGTAFRYLAEQLKDRPQTLSERLRGRGFKPRKRWVPDNE